MGQRTLTTASGSPTSIPTGATNLVVWVFGAGGAGGGNNTSADGGSGGGGGACSVLTIANPGTSYNFGVGAGGTIVSGAAGNPGGDSWFGGTSFATALCSAKGGSGGGAPSGGNPTNGGAGGLASGGVGDVKNDGGWGEQGNNAPAGRGGWGGSSGGPAVSAAGHNAGSSLTYSTFTYPTASTPANGYHGGDGGGTNTAPGAAPVSGYAGGGGGAAENVSGGAGGDGVILLSWTDPPPLAADRSDTLTVTEFAKAVLTSLAVHADDALTVADPEPTRDFQSQAPATLNANVFDPVTVAEDAHPAIPVLSVRVAEAVTVQEGQTLKDAQTTSTAGASFANTSLRQYEAADFLAGSNYVLTKVEVRLYRVGAAPSNTLTAYLYADNAGVPGTLLATSLSTVDAASVPLTPGNWFAWTFAGVALTSGTRYHLGLGAASVNASDYFVLWNTGVAGFDLMRSSDGVNWAALSADTQLAFRTYAGGPKAVLTPLTVRADEPLTVTEDAKPVIPVLSARADDAVGSTDWPEAVLLGSAALTVDVADPVSVAEDAKPVIPVLSVSVSDSVTAADATAPVLPLLVVHADEAVTATDVATAVLPLLAVAVAETLTIAEAATGAETPLVARPNEPLTVVDAATPELTDLSNVISPGVLREQYYVTRVVGVG